MRGFRIETLQWAAAALCGLMGTLLLVAPHRMPAVTGSPLAPAAWWLGVAMALAGGGLASIVVLRPAAVVVALGHAAVGLLLLLVAGTLAGIGAWFPAIAFGTLALATLVAPHVAVQPSSPPPAARRRRDAAGRDLFALLVGVANSLTGLVLLGLPTLVVRPTQGAVQPYLPLLGAAFLGGGALLVVTQLWGTWSLGARVGVNLLNVGLLLAWLVAVTRFTGSWVAWAHIVGFAALLAVQPWLAPWLFATRSATLHVRAAVVLAVAAAVPLILGVALVADRAEDAARANALADRQTLAATLAQDIADYVALHHAPVLLLANEPGLLSLPPEGQVAVMRRYLAVYPDLRAMSTARADGSPVVRSDGLTGTSWQGAAVYEEARRANAPTIEVRISPVIQRPVIVFGAPIPDASGGFGGLAATALEPDRMVALLERASAGAGRRTYLVDAQGRAIAHPDASLVASLADLSATPPVAAWLANAEHQGALAYGQAPAQWLAGYASVPGLDWGVVVEQPEGTAMAGVRTGRDLAFAILVLVLALALLLGPLTARRLTAPLNTIAHAADQLAAGNTTAPLPRSPVLELSRLASAFGAMRDRLMERTAALQASEVYSRSIVDTASDAFIAMDLHGRITDWNRAAEVTFGFTREEVIGRSLAETIIPPRYRDAHARGLERFRATGEAPILGQRMELVALHQAGREFPVELTVWSTPSEAEPAFNAFVRDITERRAVERLKDEFVSTVSHELRTPMNGIIGLTDLLLTTELTPRQQEYAEAVRESGEALLRIINDILDLSKIEAGKLELEAVDLNVRQVVESAAALLAEQAHRKGLELGVVVQRDVPTGLQGDAVRLRQVLLNLLGNALKFTEQGEVVVRARLAGQTAEAVTVQFDVSDTGIGISPEVQTHLFQPFAQADTSMTRKYGGTGLGLTIAKRLVERMGGEISVASAPGRGSTFTFTARFARIATPPRPEPPTPLDGLRVLVVDDSLASRDTLQEQLAALRMHPTCTDDGLRALALLRGAANAGTPYDVALVDEQMPAMPGRELAEAVRADPALAATRLILLRATAAAESDVAADFAAVLPKPVRQLPLLGTLARVMDDARGVPGPAPAAANGHARAPAPAPMNGPRILVVEDSAINQTLARGVLEGLGYASETADNGRDALEKLRRDEYAAVLMDCQMPEMDGYAAAREIRDREGNGTHLPIIGVTANAMPGDRERCLAAGMDDYLAKPFRPRELAVALERWVGAAGAGQTAAADAAAPPRAPDLPDPIDRACLGRLSAALVPQLIALFLETAPPRVAALRAALAEGDPAALSQVAHTFKGEAGTIGAHEVEACCRELERLGHAQTVAGGEPLLASLEGALQRTQAALRTR